MSKWNTSVAVSRISKTSAIVALAAAIVLAGCTSLKIKMGMRMNVATLPATSMDVRLAKSQGVAPGQKKPLVVTFKAADGRVWLTEGAGSGPIMWQDLTVTSTVVSVSGSGEVSLPRDPRLSDGKTGHVVVTVASHADLRAETDIPLRYDLKYYADFSGGKGFDGTAGISGTDGMRGTDGSFDPAHPTAG